MEGKGAEALRTAGGTGGVAMATAEAEANPWGCGPALH